MYPSLAPPWLLSRHLPERTVCFALSRRFLYQHRDLKLENILLETSREEGGAPSVKLVDFGLSAIYEENGVSTDVLGSWVRVRGCEPVLYGKTKLQL